MLRIFSILFFFVGKPLLALNYSLGTGYSEMNRGRSLPVLYGAFESEVWMTNIYTSGIQSQVYYTNKYQANVYKKIKFPEVFWGKIRGGLGIGFFYAQSQYRELDKTGDVKYYDFHLGPSGFFAWNFLGPIFISAEIYQGLGFSSGGISNLIYNTHRQNFALIVGCRI